MRAYLLVIICAFVLTHISRPLQLHGKVDQVGVQVGSPAGMSLAAMGAAGGLAGMGGGNSLQLQQLLLQQQMGLAGFGGGLGGLGGLGGGSGLRLRGDEIVSSVRAMVEEYEKAVRETSSGGSGHKETVTKLEERVELLQVRLVRPASPAGASPAQTGREPCQSYLERTLIHTQLPDPSAGPTQSLTPQRYF